MLVHRHRHPEVGAGERRAREAALGDADDRVRPVVEADLLPQDVIAAAEAPGPEVVAENDHRMRVRDAVFVRDEEPPRRRPCPDDVEVVSRDERGKHPLRRVGVSEAHDVRPELHRGEPGEHRALLAHPREERIAEVVESLAIRVGAPDVDQRAGSATPTRGLMRNASARLKMAALAEMPIARDSIDVSVKIGLRTSRRMA